MNAASTECACRTARHEHGTNRNYVVHRCRCFACRVAHSNAQRAYRAAKTWREMRVMPSIGVRRRLQALAAIGYNARDMSAHLDMSADYVAKIRTDTRHPLIRRETHDAVCRVYDLLWDKRRTDVNARRTMTLAAHAGYLPPLAWDDDTIDEMDKKQSYKLNSPRDNYKDTNLPGRGGIVDEIAVAEAIAGRRVRLTKAELTEAITTMTRMGFSAKQISERLGTTSRQVTRKRAAA